MPCRMDDYPIDMPKKVSKPKSTKRDQKIDHLLCEVCVLLEEHDLLSDASSELQKWYKNHEECEQDRVRYEAALKLSSRERRLFGIDLNVLKKKMK